MCVCVCATATICICIPVGLDSMPHNVVITGKTNAPRTKWPVHWKQNTDVTLLPSYTLSVFDIGILGSLAAPCFRGKPNRSSMLSQDSNKIVVRPIHDEKIKSDSIEMFKLSLVSGLPFGSLLQRIGAVVIYESWLHLFRCNKSQSESWMDFVLFVVAIDQITHQNS